MKLFADSIEADRARYQETPRYPGSAIEILVPEILVAQSWKRARVDLESRSAQSTANKSFAEATAEQRKRERERERGRTFGKEGEGKP